MDRATHNRLIRKSGHLRVKGGISAKQNMAIIFNMSQVKALDKKSRFFYSTRVGGYRGSKNPFKLLIFNIISVAPPLDSDPTE